MVGRFFEPDEKICLIFDNVDYNKLRELPEFAERYEENDLRNEFKYYDMPRAREWANEFEEGIKNYGISAEQIQRHTDSDSDTMSTAIGGAKL